MLLGLCSLLCSPSVDAVPCVGNEEHGHSTVSIDFRFVHRFADLACVREYDQRYVHSGASL